MSNTGTSNKKTLVLIQLLRGIASVLVVLLHVTVNYKENTGYTYLWNIFNFGGSGVDIFFVLSGFIITYTNRQYLAKPSATGTFLKRRFVRIFPIYWIIAGFFLLMQLALPAFYNTHFDTGVGNLFNTFLLLPGHSMVNGVSWSLTNELFFYLLFTVALLIPGKKNSLYLMIGYFLSLLVVSVAFPQIAVGNPYKDLLFFPMNLEFFLGVIIVFIVDRVPVKWVNPLLAGGITLFVAGAAIHNKGVGMVSPDFTGAFIRVWLFGIPSFLIILAVVKKELTSSVKMHPVFLHLGDASYSIYLLHLPVVAAFFKIAASLQTSNNTVLFLLSCVLLVAVCVAGILIYRFIEKPLIKKLNSLLR